jgi:hypothetical protein
MDSLLRRLTPTVIPAIRSLLAIADIARHRTCGRAALVVVVVGFRIAAGPAVDMLFDCRRCRPCSRFQLFLFHLPCGGHRSCGPLLENVSSPAADPAVEVFLLDSSAAADPAVNHDACIRSATAAVPAVDSSSCVDVLNCRVDVSGNL